MSDVMHKTVTPQALATRTVNGVATLYLYGVVGQEGEWWLSPEDQQESLTAMDFIEALNQLSENHDVIHLRINSVGGSIGEGSAICNALRSCSAKIHTFNDGLAASMAASIWLCGDVRHMATNAMLMLHSPINAVWGNAVEMREMADVLDKFGSALAQGIADVTDMDADEVIATYMTDGKDHWLTHAEATAMGFVSAEDSYESASPAPANVVATPYSKLLKEYRPAAQKAPGFLRRLRDRLAPAATITPQTPEAVTITDLNAAIERGDLSLEDVEGVVASVREAQEPTAPQATADDLRDIIEVAVTAAVKPLQTEIERLNGEVEALGNSPGDQPAAAAAGTDPGSQAGPTVLAQRAAQLAEAAANGTNPFRNLDRPFFAEEKAGSDQ